MSRKAKQRGGVSIDINENDGIRDKNDAYCKFIKNSKFELLSTSSLNGIIIKANLNADVRSPYVSIRSDSFGARIPSLILKLIFIDAPDNLSVPAIRKEIFPLTTYDGFKTEVDTQLDIFRESCLDEYALQGICPAIVNYTMIQAGHPMLRTFMNAIVNRVDGPTANTLKNCLIGMYKAFKAPENSLMQLGVIAMEYAEGFKQLISYLPRVEKGHPDYSKELNRYRQYQLFALYELKRLHKLGYVHGDLHQSNILINPNSEYFTKHTDEDVVLGKAMIIDFGRTVNMGIYEIDLPDDISTETLDSWTLYESVEAEVFYTSRRVPPNFNVETLETMQNVAFSKLFPDRVIFGSYSWMEAFSPKTNATFFTHSALYVDSYLPEKRQIMIEDFNRNIQGYFPELLEPHSENSLKLFLSPSRPLGPPVHLDPLRRLPPPLSIDEEMDEEDAGPAQPPVSVFRPIQTYEANGEEQERPTAPVPNEIEPEPIIPESVIYSPRSIENQSVIYSPRTPTQKYYSLFGGKLNMAAVDILKTTSTRLKKPSVSKSAPDHLSPFPPNINSKTIKNMVRDTIEPDAIISADDMDLPDEPNVIESQGGKRRTKRKASRRKRTGGKTRTRRSPK
jgi:serine/threonine protein kinase